MKNLIKSSVIVCLFMVINTNAQTTKSVSGFNHVESIATDGKFLSATDIGKELNPAAKDGDGKILKLEKKQNTGC